ncbi:MAG TPA: chorismate mutase [Pirellulaceae bacterium]|nr:chorismate mutase [Pirellulaceae bacterium]
MLCRGVRGATTVEANTREAILEETTKLLALMIRFNEIKSTDVASVVFTLTTDLNAEFPALAARHLGWLDVPLLCTNEINVVGGLQKCVRILIHWNTDRAQTDITHVYVNEAIRLRPDKSQLPAIDLAELESWIAEQIEAYRK